MKTSNPTSYPKEKIKIVLLEGVHPRAVQMFKTEGFSVESLPASPDQTKLTKLVQDCHVLGVRSKTLVPKNVLEAAPRLLSVGCFCIGTDQVDLGFAREKGVPVFNAPFSNTRSVAELTLAEIVMLTRQVFTKSQQMHVGQWDKSAAGAHEIRGRTLGIVGYGHIGSQVSVLAEAMGMRVLYYDVVPKLPLGNAKRVRTVADLLKESDVVTLHVPANDSTKDMIGAEQLKVMKKGSLLINNARGSVVQISALAQALKDQHITGAALDVFPHEPASKGESFESPLRNMPNVILTPHIGGSTEEAQETIAIDVVEKLLKFVNVGTTTGAVNVPEVELSSQGLLIGDARGEAGTQDEDAAKVRKSHRILHFHRNVPGVLSQVNGAVARLGVNVTAQSLRTSDQIGYLVLDVDPSDADAVRQQLLVIKETIRVRVLW